MPHSGHGGWEGPHALLGPGHGSAWLLFIFLGGTHSPRSEVGGPRAKCKRVRISGWQQPSIKLIMGSSERGKPAKPTWPLLPPKRHGPCSESTVLLMDSMVAYLRYHWMSPVAAHPAKSQTHVSWRRSLRIRTEPTGPATGPLWQPPGRTSKGPVPPQPRIKDSSAWLLCL